MLNLIYLLIINSKMSFLSIFLQIFSENDNFTENLFFKIDILFCLRRTCHRMETHIQPCKRPVAVVGSLSFSLALSLCLSLSLSLSLSLWLMAWKCASVIFFPQKSSTVSGFVLGHRFCVWFLCFKI